MDKKPSLSIHIELYNIYPFLNRVENNNKVHSFKDRVLLTMTGWNGT